MGSLWLMACEHAEAAARVVAWIGRIKGVLIRRWLTDWPLSCPCSAGPCDRGNPCAAAAGRRPDCQARMDQPKNE